MSTCSATASPASRRPAAQAAHRSHVSSSGAAGRGTNLDAANAAFANITSRTETLVIDGAALGSGLPNRTINLSELAEVLFHPSTSLDARDVVWRHLVCQSRALGEHWTIGAVGVAMPALKAMSARLIKAFQTGRVEVEEEILTGFLGALASVDVAGDRVLSRLCNPAYAAIRRTLRQQKRHMKRAADEAETPNVAANSSYDTRDEYDVLQYAVSLGVISDLEADLIAKVHLEDVSLTGYAEATGREYFAVAKSRQRAALRLKQAHDNGELAPEFDVHQFVIEETTTTVAEEYDTGRRWLAD